MMGKTFVLVHGAWHGGWVWKDVAPALRAMGHHVSTPTLTGLGERRHLAKDGYDLETHVQDVVAHIEMEDLDNVHLVGWSYGGTVATGVLGRLQDRIKSMIYLDAFVPADGQSMADLAEPWVLPKLQEARDANRPVPPIPLAVMGVEDAKIAAYAQPRLTPQAWQTFFQPVKALKERPNIPFTYIRCNKFKNPAFDDSYETFKREPRFTTHMMNTGHVPMLTHVGETISLLALPLRCDQKV